MRAAKLGLSIGGISCLLSVWLWGDAQAGPDAEKPPSLTPSSFQSPFGLVGTASCAARACHGGVEAVPNERVQQNEFTTWTGQDLHGDAYRVLLTERSKKIEMRLQASDPNKAVKDWNDAKPHEDVVCLNCHVFPDLKDVTKVPREAGRSEEELTVFGVGCEACHGPAAKWLKPHSLPDWKNLTADAKKDQGMWPVHESLDRARRCVTCHVGSATSDMNHDLIAAGHPRLYFEFTGFMANMPRHWNIKAIPEPPDETQAWVLGQAVTATAALQLLAYRVDPAKKTPDGSPKPWPEFAEYDCFACHHDLNGVQNWRQDRKPVGALVWNNWYMTMPRNLASLDKNQNLLETFDALGKAMGQPVSQRETVGDQAMASAGHLTALVKQRDPRTLLGGLITNYKTSSPDWDHAAQLYLAIAALKNRDPNAQRVIEDLVRKLSYKEGYDSPKDGAKTTAKEQRSDFDKLLEKLPK